jgi:1-acyl-sn-glycerol-3-phosphate acyltransferase
MNLDVQFKPNKLAGFVLKTLGWTLDFQGFPGSRGVLVVYPHTSNWDFPVGLLAKWATGMQANFLIKDLYLKLPLLGRWFAWIGGRAVDRSSPQGYVKELSKEMLAAPYFWLVVTPEGTRKKTDGFRTGFYRLGLEAGVPLCLATIDFGRRHIGISTFYRLTGDEAQDMAHIAHVYEGTQGFHPQCMSPVVLLHPHHPDKSKQSTQKRQ